MKQSAQFESLLDEWLEGRDDYVFTYADMEELNGIGGDLARRYLETRRMLQDLELPEETIGDIEQEIGLQVDELLTRDWFQDKERKKRGEKVGTVFTTTMVHAIPSVMRRRVESLGITVDNQSLRVSQGAKEPTINSNEWDFPTLIRVADLDDLNSIRREGSDAIRRDFYRMIAVKQVEVAQRYGLPAFDRLPPFLRLTVLRKETPTELPQSRRRKKRRNVTMEENKN